MKLKLATVKSVKLRDLPPGPTSINVSHPASCLVPPICVYQCRMSLSHCWFKHRAAAVNVLALHVVLLTCNLARSPFSQVPFCIHKNLPYPRTQASRPSPRPKQFQTLAGWQIKKRREILEGHSPARTLSRMENLFGGQSPDLCESSVHWTNVNKMAGNGWELCIPRACVNAKISNEKGASVEKSQLNTESLSERDLRNQVLAPTLISDLQLCNKLYIHPTHTLFAREGGHKINVPVVINELHLPHPESWIFIWICHNMATNY